jgi:hypothetical protein
MGNNSGMITRHVGGFVGSAVAAAGTLSVAVLSAWAVPAASAQPCPDVEVVWARGTDEPPGVGSTGQAFVDALGPRVGGKSVEVYPVDYPATHEWATGLDGVRDAGAHVVSTAAGCPQTKMVLGGYSQGAAVMGFVTSEAVPDRIDPASVPKPLQPDVAEHVAAVVLFGTPNERAMEFLGEPPVVVGPVYQAKTVQLCAPEDPVCSEGMDFAAHDTYPGDGDLINQGADYVASRLQGNPGATVQVGSPHQGFGS